MVERMTSMSRLEILLDPEQYRELSALAKATQMPLATLARRGVAWVLAKRDVLLTGHGGMPASLQKFLDQVAADARTAPHAEMVADALNDLDIEADGNPDAA